MIIDVNCLNDDILKQYLTKDKNNLVVFNEYACMESYKGDSLKSIYNAMKTVSKYPKQVVVIKGLRDIVRLQEESGYLDFNFDDTDQTASFKEFCLSVNAAYKGESHLRSQICQLGLAANKQFNLMIEQACYFEESIPMIAAGIRPENLKLIRNGGAYPEELLEYIVKFALALTFKLFEMHPDASRVPSVDECPDSYIFRHSLAVMLLSLQRLSKGYSGNVKRDKLLNDLVDMHYVTYATYYDGILTKDKKMLSIYEETKFLLDEYFLLEKVRREI